MKENEQKGEGGQLGELIQQALDLIKAGKTELGKGKAFQEWLRI